MATPNEKLAASLDALKSITDKAKGNIIKSSEISRTHRERLSKNGFLTEVLRGWYIVSSPSDTNYSSTQWYANYWVFTAKYLNETVGEQYTLTPEQSVLRHAGVTTIPKQLVVRALRAQNRPVDLPFNTSYLIIKSTLPEHGEIEKMDGINVLTKASALVNLPESSYRKYKSEIQVLLLSFDDASDILSLLLKDGKSIVAGRIAGAFESIGKHKIAKDILGTMQSVGYDVREENPFETVAEIANIHSYESPYAIRMTLKWKEWREYIIKNFPKSSGIPPSEKEKNKLILEIEKAYKTDAYHSLSIERYKVTPELIELVKSGKWNAELSENDAKEKNAMAARGYWQATQSVMLSIRKILDGQNPGAIIDNDHGDWYRQLFAPSVNAGIIEAKELAGYRSGQVYITNSMHVPVSPHAVRSTMPKLFELLENEAHAGVRAVLGHFFFVFIHPYMDGNGRMARFIMNAMLISGGYPWTIIPVDLRDRYMDSLESASVSGDITPFADLVIELLKATMEGRPLAK